jgi:hypothetical protein
VREEGACKGSERRERRRKRGLGWWRVQEDAAKGAGGAGRGEAGEGASGGEHGGLAGGRAEPTEGFGSFYMARGFLDTDWVTLLSKVTT